MQIQSFKNYLASLNESVMKMKTDESKISIQRMKLESKGVWF